MYMSFKVRIPSRCMYDIWLCLCSLSLCRPVPTSYPLPFLFLFLLTTLTFDESRSFALWNVPYSRFVHFLVDIFNTWPGKTWGDEWLE